MNKTEYLKQLNTCLKHLPKEDREDALHYYEEYFEDMGIDDTVNVSEQIGTPEEIAKEIIANCTEKHIETQKRKRRCQKQHLGYLDDYPWNHCFTGCNSDCHCRHCLPVCIYHCFVFTLFGNCMRRTCAVVCRNQFLYSNCSRTGIFLKNIFYRHRFPFHRNWYFVTDCRSFVL